MDKYYQDFIENLKFYREKKKLTQEQLAELCEVSTSTISGIESFHQNPSIELFFKFAAVLNIHPADLLLRDTSKTENIELFRKYSPLIENCEYIADPFKTAVYQLAQTLAESSPKYSASN